MNDQRRMASLKPGDGLQAACELIRQAICGSDHDARVDAITQATGFENECLLQPLVDSLRDPDEEIRALAAIALGGYDARLAIERLLEATNDGSDWVRECAVETLADFGGQEVHAALVSKLSDPALRVRGSVIAYLARCGEDADVEKLIDSARRSLDDRILVARGLAERESEKVREFMETAIDKNDLHVITAAHRYFIKRDPVPISLLVTALQEEDRNELVVDTAKTFVRSGIPKLVDAGQARLDSLSSLCAIGDDSVEALARRLREIASELEPPVSEC